MKLYQVTLNHTTVLLAESADEAARAARSHEIDILKEETHGWTVDRELKSMDDMPEGWRSGGVVPWNTETFDTVETVVSVLDQRKGESE